MKHRLSKTFGKSRVNPQQREQMIRRVFKRVAPRYDLMNDLMSMGIHRLWKRKFCSDINPLHTQRLVDLAGGTGDIAQALSAKMIQLIIIDPSIEMMAIARQRLPQNCDYICASAEHIPLPDECVDFLTISFGIRNTTDIKASLQEIARVLKPGGRFYCLEFSRPYAWLRPFYELWSRTVIPRLGALVAGYPEAYHYLIESIREFPAQQEMVELIEDAGLVEVNYRNLSFGIACIHRATKPGLD